jgi:hypothetical protein
MFICFVFHSYIFLPWFIHCQQGGEEVSLMQIQKRWAKIRKYASTCPGGAFLLFFRVELVLCSACDLSLPFFGFGRELSFFVLLSFYFLSLNFISRSVLSMHSSRGRLRTRSVPVVGGWPLLSDEWLTMGVGLSLGSVRRCRLRPSSCCCRWRTGAKGLQHWGASGRWRDK